MLDGVWDSQRRVEELFKRPAGLSETSRYRLQSLPDCSCTACVAG